MKLFLASSPDLNQTQLQELLRLTGKEKLDKILVITAGAVPYGLNPRPTWVDRQVEPLKTICHEIVETTLEAGSFIPSSLSDYDVIFLSGGNTFYLAYRLAETGWDQKLKEFVKNGGVFAGSSAGSLIATKDFSHVAPADDPSKAPAVYPGLGFIEQALVVHSNHPKYAPIMAKVAEAYVKDGYEVIKLNDDQVLVVEDGQQKVI